MQLLPIAFILKAGICFHVSNPHETLWIWLTHLIIIFSIYLASPHSHFTSHDTKLIFFFSPIFISWNIPSKIITSFKTIPHPFSFKAFCISRKHIIFSWPKIFNDLNVDDNTDRRNLLHCWWFLQITFIACYICGVIKALPPKPKDTWKVFAH